MSNESKIEDLLLMQILAVGIPSPKREYKFFPKRRWKFDFAWPDRMIAVEVEGGTWGKGRHTSGTGYHNDCVKYNAATITGWQVYRFTSKAVKEGHAIEFLTYLMGDERHASDLSEMLWRGSIRGTSGGRQSHSGMVMPILRSRILHGQAAQQASGIRHPFLRTGTRPGAEKRTYIQGMVN